jgi:hypothetical protein
MANVSFISIDSLAPRGFKVFALKTALILFSALSFLGYGSACFFSSRMKQEFLRYRLASQRVIVGALQWFAGIGLLAGMSQPWMGQAAAGGLALMMLVAIVVRIQIKDSLPQTIPALFYLALNAYLCLEGF